MRFLEDKMNVSRFFRSVLHALKTSDGRRYYQYNNTCQLIWIIGLRQSLADDVLQVGAAGQIGPEVGGPDISHVISEKLLHSTTTTSSS